jgi:excisionase family DNA binding protein
MDFQSLLSQVLKLHEDQQRLVQEEIQRSLAPPKIHHSVGQVAEICQVTNATIRRWFDRGELRGYRIPGDRVARIRGTDLNAFLLKKKIDAQVSNSATFSSGQAADIIGVTSQTVIRWVRTGKLACYFIPGKQIRRIANVDLIKFANKRGIQLKSVKKTAA